MSKCKFLYYILYSQNSSIFFYRVFYPGQQINPYTDRYSKETAPYKVFKYLGSILRKYLFFISTYFLRLHLLFVIYCTLSCSTSVVTVLFRGIYAIFSNWRPKYGKYGHYGQVSIYFHQPILETIYIYVSHVMPHFLPQGLLAGSGTVPTLLYPLSGSVHCKANGPVTAGFFVHKDTNITLVTSTQFVTEPLRRSKTKSLSTYINPVIIRFSGAILRGHNPKKQEINRVPVSCYWNNFTGIM